MAKKLKVFAAKKKTAPASTSPEVKPKVTGGAQVAKCVTAITKPKPKFSAEDEARIQAELKRLEDAKHEQMIAEEIRNRLVSG